MHATDDVHARGAAMVARACKRAGRTPMRHQGRAADADREAGVLRLIHALDWGKSVGADIERLKALNAFDAALARAFDEA